MARPAVALGVVEARFAQTLVDSRGSEGSVDNHIVGTFIACGGQTREGQ